VSVVSDDEVLLLFVISGGEGTAGNISQWHKPGNNLRTEDCEVEAMTLLLYCGNIQHEVLTYKSNFHLIPDIIEMYLFPFFNLTVKCD
jgi:hypothetical protein